MSWYIDYMLLNIEKRKASHVGTSDGRMRSKVSIWTLIQSLSNKEQLREEAAKVWREGEESDGLLNHVFFFYSSCWLGLYC